MSDVDEHEIHETATELFPPGAEKDPPREGWAENQSEVERMGANGLLRIRAETEYNDKEILKMRYARGDGYPSYQVSPADTRAGKPQFINVLLCLITPIMSSA